MSRNRAQICQGGIDEGDLDFFQVDAGGISPGEMAHLTYLFNRIDVCFSKRKTDLGIIYLWGDSDRNDASTVRHYSVRKSPAVSGGCWSYTKPNKVFLFER